jgi:hypothetical protein
MPIVRSLRRALAALVVLAALPRDAALAATVSLIPGGDGRGIVVVEGDIEEGDGDRFAAAVDGRDVSLVVFSSAGGRILEAVAIGELIRARGFDTGVLAGSVCASACALAWLGGITRMMESGATVGFHAAYSLDEDGVARENGAANALVGAYLTTLGYPIAVVLWATGTGPQGLAYLDDRTGREIGLEFVRIGPDNGKDAQIRQKRFPAKSLVQKRFPKHPPDRGAPSGRRPR